ncbi:deaminase [Actinoplanes sp. OR16]|uniref:dihydrofolate reductase family protein n=1 Tax=Actinoplanes sp. OR16 TaxID=946334 RepID=UPI000F6DCA7F|nr:dihydrofolate reductase family protein [Actinoplanes sp. OR16]BBH67659.1 deaminase [Actinoplanes sp. OR16]
MRKLVYFVAGTIDGFIAAPDGSWEWMGVTEDVVRFMVESYPETVPTQARGPLGVPDGPNPRFDTVVMGRRTYDPALAEGITSPYAHLRQIVFSRTLAPASDVEIVDGDPLDFVTKLKQEEGQDIWLAGGGEFAGQLLPLVDELVIKLNPILAGDGVPLAKAAFDPHRFTLIGTKPLPSGVVVLHYVVHRSADRSDDSVG